jgi:hypothetical protein
VVSESAVATVGIRLRSITFGPADLLLFANLAGVPDRARWECRQPQGYGYVQARPRHPQILISGYRTYVSDSLKDLILLAPRGQLRNFKARIETGSKVFCIEASSEEYGYNTVRLSYEGPDAGANEEFKEIAQQVFAPKALRSTIKQVAKFAVLIAFLSWVGIAISDVASNSTEIAQKLTSGQSVPASRLWKILSLFPAFLIWAIATGILASGGVRLKPLIRIRARHWGREFIGACKAAMARISDEFLHGQHDRNAVFVATMALIVALLAWLFPLK